MRRYKLVALTNPVEGRETEYNAWYDQFHLPETCQVPGVISGQRFKRVGTPKENGDSPRYEYLVEYEVESDDPQATLELLAQHIQSGRIGRNYDLMQKVSWTAMFEYL